MEAMTTAECIHVFENSRLQSESFTPEAITAAHCGMPLLALSVMTNMAAGVLDRPLTDTEVDETARRIAAMDIPCFACAPERLPELLERCLKGQSLDGLADQGKK